MDDLATRLRALADPKEYPEHPALWERDMQLALREAAAALEAVEKECKRKNCIGLEEEVEALKADNEYLNGCMKSPTNNFEEGSWGYDIHNHAQAPLLREIEALKSRLAEAEHDKELAAGELRMPIAAPGTDLGRLMCANASMRRERDEARSECAALREALGEVLARGQPLYDEFNNHSRYFNFFGSALYNGKKALSQPGPGAALLSRLKLLESVAEAAKDAYGTVMSVANWQPEHFDILYRALTALDKEEMP